MRVLRFFSLMLLSVLSTVLFLNNGNALAARPLTPAEAQYFWDKAWEAKSIDKPVQPHHCKRLQLLDNGVVEYGVSPNVDGYIDFKTHKMVINVLDCRYLTYIRNGKAQRLAGYHPMLQLPDGSVHELGDKIEINGKKVDVGKVALKMLERDGQLGHKMYYTLVDMKTGKTLDPDKDPKLHFEVYQKIVLYHYLMMYDFTFGYKQRHPNYILPNNMVENYSNVAGVLRPKHFQLLLERGIIVQSQFDKVMSYYSGPESLLIDQLEYPMYQKCAKEIRQDPITSSEIQQYVKDGIISQSLATRLISMLNNKGSIRPSSPYFSHSQKSQFKLEEMYDKPQK